MMHNLIGNKTTEKDVRDWLDANGFFGRTATFGELELHAIQRPGWQQVFRFQVKAKSHEESDNPWKILFGVVQDDERKTLKSREPARVTVFDSAELRDDFLLACSRGMMQSGQRSGDNPAWIIVGGIGFLALVLFLLRILG